MATKTITIMEDAYEILARAKLPDESFSEVIRRVVVPKRNLTEFFGVLSDEDARTIKKVIKEGRAMQKKRAKWIESRFV